MDLSGLTPLFDPSQLYAGGKEMAAYVAATVTPVALAISLWLRLGASQLDTVTSGAGKWSAFARDLALWLPVLGMYFAAASLVTELFQALYNAFHARGSAAGTHATFARFLEDIESREPQGVLGALSFLASGALIVPWTLYYFSMFMSSLVFIFMQLAHALAYSFALSWGLVAIPLSIGNIRLLRGWGLFSGAVLLWPVVHYVAFALFNPLFTAAADHYLSGGGVLSAVTDKMQYYLILTTVNFIAAALSMSAPFVATALVNNSGSLHGLVTPFAAAATAMAATGTGIAHAAGRRAGQSGRSAPDDGDRSSPPERSGGPAPPPADERAPAPQPDAAAGPPPADERAPAPQPVDDPAAPPPGPTAPAPEPEPVRGG